MAPVSVMWLAYVHRADLLDTYQCLVDWTDWHLFTNPTWRLDMWVSFQLRRDREFPGANVSLLICLQPKKT
jgi:hypothetical protein